MTNTDFTGNRDIHFKSFLDRQQAIEDTLQFRCSCSRCRKGHSTDDALHQILKQQQALDNWDDGTLVTTGDALNLIMLYRQEGLESFLDVAYGYAALAYNAVGNVREAQRYARLAIAVLLSNGVTEGPNYTAWEELARSPVDHWSWRRRDED